MEHVLTIAQVFSERMFRVPDYQRGYAWEEKQWDEFLEDVELLPDGKEHYTGTLVLHALDVPRVEDDEGRTYAVFDVVDGQQRLTTIVVLLDVLRREMAQRPALQRLAEGTHKTYVAVRDGHGRNAWKLRLGGDLHTWFEEKVLADTPSPGEPTTAAQRRLLGAQEHFIAYLKKAREARGEEYDEWLRELRAKVTGRLKVGLYVVGDAAEVGVVFEVMNNRGKPLAELEKVKNYILYLSTKLVAPGDLRDKTNTAWATIFENLMEAGLGNTDHEDRLLRAHWLMAYDPTVKNWHGTASVKRHFSLRGYDKRHGSLREDLLEYVRTLRDASLAYRDVFAPQHTQAYRGFGTSDTITALKLLGEKLLRLWVSAPFVPLLLAVRLRAPSDAEGYHKVLDLCERYAFRVYRWARVRSSAGQSTLFKLAHEHHRGVVDHASALSTFRGLLLHYNPEVTFQSALAEQARDEDNDWFNWDGLKYFLYEYEEHCAGKETVRIPWRVISAREIAKTVEHILPQTPTDPYWKTHFSAIEVRRYTHDIGNLCLTSHNPSLGNKSFPSKKGVPGDTTHCYANSLLASEKALAAWADWDKLGLLKRRAEIVAWARERWRVAGDSTKPESLDDDAEADVAVSA